MTPAQFREFIIRPILQDMNLWSKEAEDLMLGTAIHESDGMARITQYNGPALSYYQMEPATLNDLYENFLDYRPEKKALLDQYKISHLSPEQNLITNMAYATAAARLNYYRVKESIPKSLNGQAHYWKKYWNTIYGKGSQEQYLAHWHDHV